jgi:pimeloyl-ACP methyl ester carboxylesterase
METRNVQRRFHLDLRRGRRPWYWHLVVPKLVQHGCEAIPVAIPAANDSAGLRDDAVAVLEAIADRDPARVVLVAQSLEGFTASLVCTRLPVRMLVFVNAMIPKTDECPVECFDNTHQRLFIALGCPAKHAAEDWRVLLA